ncbi:MAG TPA: cold-shock protein [Alphaproteobacteria bacterium]|nr:cold-shock protein [Alphaproteobacteria bacterium]
MYDRRPSQPAAILRRDAAATVKWYNPTKGFGFVTFDDGSPDAFLHVSAVQAAGHDQLNEGARLVCDVSQGQRGLQVAAIHSVEAGSGAPPRERRQRDDFGGGYGAGGNYGGGGGYGSGGGYGGGGGGFGGGARRERFASTPGETIEGKVKFFSPDKGFGFVTPDNGGKDVFVHVKVLERAGLRSLEPEQRVRVETSMGQKGPQADRVEIL